MNTFTKTEAERASQLPAVGEFVAPPKGLGRPRHKPLMRNARAGSMFPAGPKGNTAGNTFDCPRCLDGVRVGRVFDAPEQVPVRFVGLVIYHHRGRATTAKKFKCPACHAVFFLE